jgi:hypothetical protein
METCRGPRLRGHSTCPLEEGTRRLACPRYDARGAVSLLCSALLRPTLRHMITQEARAAVSRCLFCSRNPTAPTAEPRARARDRTRYGRDRRRNRCPVRSGWGRPATGRDTPLYSGATAAAAGTSHAGSLLAPVCGCVGVWVCGCVGAWVDAMRSTDFACVGPCGVEWMQGRAGRDRGGWIHGTWVRYMGHAQL